MQIIKRRAAADAGLKRFYTGVPCHLGHVSERYVSTGSCIECLRRPIGMMVRVTVEVHQADRKDLEAYANALNLTRGVRPAADIDAPMRPGEAEYRRMVQNYRKGGCPEQFLPRTNGTFTLPDGEMP